MKSALYLRNPRDAGCESRYQYTLDLAVTVPNVTGDLLGKVLDGAVAAGGNLLQIQDVNVRCGL